MWYALTMFLPLSLFNSFVFRLADLVLFDLPHFGFLESLKLASKKFQKVYLFKLNLSLKQGIVFKVK